MVAIYSDKDNCGASTSGSLKEITFDVLLGLRTFFIELAKSVDEDAAFTVYRLFVEALNEGDPLDWGEILKEAREEGAHGRS